mmetsp:Transcript_166595/g.319770  ORF Transcript_166595/g.319770 Transcript_166595/m.319770 type:complete len:148 (+) Transcript_166595:2-445(+)
MEAIPDVYLMTDIICGFPAESVQDWAATVALVKKYKFHGVYSSKFFARKGTPAARMRGLERRICNERYQEMCKIASSYNRNEGLAGRRERVWFLGTEDARAQTVGRTKTFARVVVPRDDKLLGRSALVQIGETCVSHVEGHIIGDLQ